MTGGGEPAHVAAVTNEVTRDDRTDTEYLGHRGPRRLHRFTDPAVELDQGAVGAANLVEELDRDPFPFGPDEASIGAVAL